MSENIAQMVAKWLPKSTQNWQKSDKKHDHKPYWKNHQKNVKIDASRPCWERFWLQSEFKSQDSSMVKNMSKKYPKNDPKLSQNPTKYWLGSWPFFDLKFATKNIKKCRPKGSQMEAKIQPKCTPRRSPERLWHQLGPKKPPGHQKYPKYDLQAPQNC